MKVCALSTTRSPGPTLLRLVWMDCRSCERFVLLLLLQVGFCYSSLAGPGKRYVLAQGVARRWTTLEGVPICGQQTLYASHSSSSVLQPTEEYETLDTRTRTFGVSLGAKVLRFVRMDSASSNPNDGHRLHVADLEIRGNIVRHAGLSWLYESEPLWKSIGSAGLFLPLLLARFVLVVFGESSQY